MVYILDMMISYDNDIIAGLNTGSVPHQLYSVCLLLLYDIVGFVQCLILQTFPNRSVYISASSILAKYGYPV